MKDDLASILESIAKTQANILGRLDKLELQQNELGIVESPVPSGWGYCSPTSPPSKKVLIRRAYAWAYDMVTFNVAFGRSWENFQRELPISAFTNAYYYRYVIVQLNLDFYATWSMLGTYESGNEHETYEECAGELEDDFQAGMVFTYDAGDVMFPLCAIAIRNDGTTGVANSYLPITLTDRLKSSFILRDLRPWFTPTRVQ